MLLQGTTGTFVIRSASLGILFVTQILLARIMGVTEFGVYSLVMACIVLLARLTTGGMDTSATRFISSYRSEKDWLSVSQFRRYSEKYILLLSLLTIPAFALILFITLNLSEISRYWVTGSILLLILSMLTLRQGILQGLLLIKQSFIPDSIIRPGLLALISVFIMFSGMSMDASNMLSVHLLAAGVALFVSSFFLRHIKLEKNAPNLSTDKHHEWTSVSRALYGIGVITVAQTNIGVIVLGILSDDASIGFYSVAARIGELTAFGLIAVNMAFAPIASELFQKRDHKTLQKVLTQSANYGFIIAIIVAITLLILGPEILGAFGKDFFVAYVPMVILVGAQVINAASGPVTIIMMMTNYQAIALKISLFSFILNTMLCFILIPEYGAIGAAIAGGVALVSWRAVALVYLYKKERIKTWPSWFSINSAI